MTAYYSWEKEWTTATNSSMTPMPMCQRIESRQYMNRRRKHFFHIWFIIIMRQQTKCTSFCPILSVTSNLICRNFYSFISISAVKSSWVDRRFSFRTFACAQENRLKNRTYFERNPAVPYWISAVTFFGYISRAKAYTVFKFTDIFALLYLFHFIFLPHRK